MSREIMRNPNNNLIPNLFMNTVEAAKIWRGKCELRGLGEYFNEPRKPACLGWNTNAEAYYFSGLLEQYDEIMNNDKKVNTESREI